MKPLNERAHAPFPYFHFMEQQPRQLLLGTALLFSLGSVAQEVPINIEGHVIVPAQTNAPVVHDGSQPKSVAETMPSFPGGDAELFNYLMKNLEYPSSARKDRVSGVVYTTFVVDTDGTLKDIQVLSGVREDIDQAAVDLIQRMPLWIPGTQDGIPVRVQYNLPILFQIR